METARGFTGNAAYSISAYSHFAFRQLLDCAGMFAGMGRSEVSIYSINV